MTKLFSFSVHNQVFYRQQKTFMYIKWYCGLHTVQQVLNIKQLVHTYCPYNWNIYQIRASDHWTPLIVTHRKTAGEQFNMDRVILQLVSLALAVGEATSNLSMMYKCTKVTANMYFSFLNSSLPRTQR